MAYDPIDLGLTANDRAGDKWRAGGVKINAMFQALYNLVAKSTSTYWFDDNDALTATTPISHTAGATGTYLTNNGLGSFTNQYNPDSKDRLWNRATGKFDFTSLKIGDTVEFRGDIEINNAAAQETSILMSLAEGTAGPFELNVSRDYYKTAATGSKVTFIFRVYIGNEITRTGGARFRFASAAATTIKVNGWFYQITEV